MQNMLYSKDMKGRKRFLSNCYYSYFLYLHRLSRRPLVLGDNDVVVNVASTIKLQWAFVGRWAMNEEAINLRHTSAAVMKTHSFDANWCLNDTKQWHAKCARLIEPRKEEKEAKEREKKGMKEKEKFPQHTTAAVYYCRR